VSGGGCAIQPEHTRFRLRAELAALHAVPGLRCTPCHDNGLIAAPARAGAVLRPAAGTGGV
jgi:hypothetical protein